ncbi:Ferredoxin-type protein NapF (periplasmic nitrate reductase) [hydrothermal vent metagenome]|uniref:Ferredoxin-type protein NapF (Periplasmic nitrate reductase) n=1 Tax=hydrothermal vent metagenome TaxID=652676 RepID=A0A1W1BU69_9ZZZZ
MQRRDFFKNLTQSIQKKDKEETLVRPPYFKNGEDFARCIECEGLCAKSCETEIIKIAEDKTPYLDFFSNGCTFCDECANVCPKDILKLEYKERVNIDVVIDPKKCMSWAKTICFSCKEPCLENAIEFTGMFYPEIKQEQCTGCGFCIGYCPSEAIIVYPKKEEDGNV